MLPIKSCNQVVDKVLMLVLCSLTPRHPHSACKVWTKAMFVPGLPYGRLSACPRSHADHPDLFTRQHPKAGSRTRESMASELYFSYVQFSSYTRIPTRDLS